MEHNIKYPTRIPERLEKLFALKGIGIEDHQVIQTGGGGLCGANSVSLHTTGSQEMGQEIHENVNEHLVQNWPIYSDSYEFPYTERVGAGSKTFEDELEFLRFLREEDDASKLWMTHVDMQAVSTMLNINIHILTTGLSIPSSHRCGRCKPIETFNSEDELRAHIEEVHHRAETYEEREGRKQNARWSEIKPDPRITDKTAAKNPEDLILLHEDDIHYNLIVHKSHNTVNNSHKGTETIFGEFLFKTPQSPNTWAEVTKKSILPQSKPDIKEPTNINTEEEVKVLNNTNEGWNIVTNKRKFDTKGVGKISPQKKKQVFVIPTRNRFDNISNESEDILVNTDAENIEMHTCNGCSYRFNTKATLDDHKRSAHGTKNKGEHRGLESNKDELIINLRKQLNIERKARKETNIAYETLEKEYRACETVLTVVQEENSRFKITIKDLKLDKELTEAKKNEINTVVTNPDNNKEGNIECKDCGYPCMYNEKLEIHVKKHLDIRTEVPTEQTCHICKDTLNSVPEFKKHMTIRHIQYNCEHCSFQAGTQLVLSKHLNLKHKAPGEKAEETLRCDECTEQFSSNWNLNNHTRDTHGTKTECTFFQQGRCRYP